MKRNLLFAIILFASSLSAQTTELKLMRDLFKLEKKSMVSDYVELSEDQAQKFWKIYDKYEAERQISSNKYIEALQKLTDGENGISDELKGEFVETSFLTQKNLISLRQKYYKLLKKELSPIIATQFIEIEEAIEVTVRAQLASKLLLLINPAQ